MLIEVCVCWHGHRITDPQVGYCNEVHVCTVCNMYTQSHHVPHSLSEISGRYDP